MTISYVEPLSRAVERMRRILFQPFDLVKWLVIGFSAWLAGLAASGGNGGSRIVFDPEDLALERHVITDAAEVWESMWENVFLAPLMLLLMTLALALLLLLLWVSSRAKFIFLDNVVNNRAQIVEPWARFRRLGNSLFLWRFGFIVVTGLMIGGVLLVVLAPAATLSFNEVLRGLSFVAVFFAVLLVAGLAVLAAYVALFLENFVVPIMYRFDLKTSEAWRAFLPWLKNRGGWFFVYGLFVIAVAIPLAVLFGILVCCTCCIIALPYIGTVILLPLWVTYRLFGPEFLKQFDENFDLFLSPPAEIESTTQEP